MLIKAKKEEIEEYMDFIYSIALKPTCSGYPIFYDGSKTKEDFVEHIHRSVERTDREILLFKMDGRVKGVVQFFYIEEEHYLQTNGFYIDGNIKKALSEFVEYLEENFKGYQLYFGFPQSNREATSYLEENGWKMTDDLYHDIFFLEQYKICGEDENIRRVTRENYSDFKELHKIKESEEMYWNSERLLGELENWNIYLYYKKGMPVGSIYYRDEEIYGIDYKNGKYNEGVYKILLTKVLNDGKKSGEKYIIFFQEEDSQDAALELGFTCAGKYVLYVKAGQ